MIKMTYAAGFLMLSLAQQSLAAPVCSSAISDTDNDGWGWENAQSCRVLTNQPGILANANSCIDTDPIGDGWGWDGISSCRVVAAAAANVNVAPAPAAANCIDTDPVGDGWGWDGVSSCRVTAPPEPAAPEARPLAPSCIDTDPVGDGWGWDGSQSCRVADSAITLGAVPEPQVAEAGLVCVDSDPVGDGWGWNGESSCRLVAAGSDVSAPTSTVSAKSWTRVGTGDGSRATARHESGAVALNDKIYLLGGRGNRPVDVYDRGANKWRQLGRLPMEMHHFQPVALNGKIYVLGAMTCCFPNESAIDNVWVMDAASGNWQSGASIPADRRRGSAAAVVHNNRIYLVGGNTRGHSGGAVAWFDEFDPATGAWRRLANAPHARDHAGAAIVAGRLVISAGRRTSQPDTFGNTVAATDVYNFATGRWTSAASIPTRRGGAMVAAIGNELLVIGGESNSQYRAHSQVEAFDVTNGNWRRLPALITGRHSGGAAVLSDGIHVVAGASNRGGGSEISSHERLHQK